MIYAGIRSEIGSAIRTAHDRIASAVDFEAQLIAFFASGVNGIWSSRKDAAARFQDAAGLAVAAAVGSQVGLILSRDRALVLGAELHTPNTGSPAWNAGLARWVMSRSVGGTVVSYATNVAIAAGRLYRVEFDAYPDGGAVPHVTNFRATAGGGQLAAPLNATVVTAAQRVTGYAMSTTAGALTLFGGDGNNGNTWGAANLSVREFLGNYQIQPMASLRPLYQVGPQRLVFDGVDDVLNTTFAAALGANCTVGRAIPGTGAVITTGVAIGTSFADNVTASALLIADRALTAGESALWTAYLNQQALL